MPGILHTRVEQGRASGWTVRKPARTCRGQPPTKGGGTTNPNNPDSCQRRTFFPNLTPDCPTRLEDLGLSDQDREAPHEHLANTWPGESDFDLAVERFLIEALDSPSPSRSE